MSEDCEKSGKWRRVVAREAHEATLREARERWKIEDHPANYRWTHVQAVVPGAGPDVSRCRGRHCW